ncbi:hypothetical protein HPG69_016853 [Diceros bicornis minor]|uniref:Uncharacterized protein n=1 Tax=Diceros bicornis minor TaxID=77932 RepID=A0A7J7EC19_DICBM|nr:hypothetical protein HPG69_016853 [Diceros bicornis minor]
MMRKFSKVLNTNSCQYELNKKCCCSAYMAPQGQEGFPQWKVEMCKLPQWNHLEDKRRGQLAPCAGLPLKATPKAETGLGVDLGHVNVTELLHSHSDLVLVGFDIHNEHKCAAVFYLLHGRFGSQGELDDSMVVKLVSPGGTLLRLFGLPPELLLEAWHKKPLTFLALNYIPNFYGCSPYAFTHQPGSTGFRRTEKKLTIFRSSEREKKKKSSKLTDLQERGISSVIPLILKTLLLSPHFNCEHHLHPGNQKEGMNGIYSLMEDLCSRAKKENCLIEEFLSPQNKYSSLNFIDFDFIDFAKLPEQ